MQISLCCYIVILMENNNVFIGLLQLLAGIGIFLTGCDIMSSNLEAASSDRMKQLLAKVSNNKIVGVLIGAAATIVIQSSSATTVMAIGFVNARIISLLQAATIIFGAEIGTTLTGQLVALGMFGDSEISLSVLFSALAGLGVFVTMFSRKEKVRIIGNVLTGLGLLFAGLSTMSGAMSGFAQYPQLKDFIATLQSSFLLILIGALLTALIQSSSALTSIAITMVAAGLISISQGIYLTLGANVGTCLTGMLAGAKSDSVNAKRTSLLQLIFNVGGVALVYFSDILLSLLTSGKTTYGTMISSMFPDAPHTQLAMFHTIFNIASVVIALPFTEKLVAFTERLIKDEPVQNDTEHFYYVNENMISTPTVAVDQIKQEIENMSNIAIQNFNIAVDMIKTLNFETEEDFVKNEKELNFLNENLVDLVLKIVQSGKVSGKDLKYLSTTYKAISDLERIGDYAENIVEYAHNLSSSNSAFSKTLLAEIEAMRRLINNLYLLVLISYKSGKRKLSKEIKEMEANIDSLSQHMTNIYITRLNNNELSGTSGTDYLKFYNDTERIGDHLINLIDQDYILSH